jgi:hypothetical protein
VDEFFLVRREERLGYGIVVADSGSAERAPDAAGGAVVGELARRVLRSMPLS